MKTYCTQNNGDCETCSLVNYRRDCRNNPIDKRIPVLIPEAHYEILRKLAFDTREPMAEHIRQAIAEYLERQS